MSAASWPPTAGAPDDTSAPASARAADEIVTLLVALAEEGTDVWQTTEGRHVRGNLYEVLPTPGHDPSRSKWEFPPGTIVECFRSTRADGSAFLVAVRAVEMPTPPPR